MSVRLQLTEPYTTLPRGGYLLETSVGYIQFGSPPETIKDTMYLPRSTPQIFVLPKLFFHVNKGISVAELEFPIYYNFYLRQKKTYIVCTRDQRDQLITVLNESVFGPELVDLRSEYPEGEETDGYPDMRAEMEHFRGDRQLSDLVQFVVFNDDGEVRLNDVTIYKLSSGEFRVLDAKWDRERTMPGEIGFNIIYDTGERLPEPYEPRCWVLPAWGPVTASTRKRIPAASCCGFKSRGSWSTPR